jgi:two-component system invasion response regulator UvrY
VISEQKAEGRKQGAKGRMRDERRRTRETEGEKTVNVLIADDHPIIRYGLKQILSEEPDIGILGEAQNCGEVLEYVRKQKWHLVILDISMPGRGGIDVLKELKHQYPKLPVLVLSMHPEEQYAKRALKVGAAGYLNKGNAQEELVKAVRKILQGGKYVSPALAEKLANDLEAESEKPLHETLSDREYEVMLLIASGKTVSQIAVELTLSVKTIDTYRSRILEKMKMKTNAELMHFAIKNKLVD